MGAGGEEMRGGGCRNGVKLINYFEFVNLIQFLNNDMITFFEFFEVFWALATEPFAIEQQVMPSVEAIVKSFFPDNFSESCSQ